MKLLGLNSPEIFIILVILLIVLGPKRIEKGYFLFKKILKFLLSKEESKEIEVKSEEPEESEVKQEIIDSEVKSEEPEESEVKEEIIEAKVKSKQTKKPKVKREIKEKKVKLKEPKTSSAKD